MIFGNVANLTTGFDSAGIQMLELARWLELCVELVGGRVARSQTVSTYNASTGTSASIDRWWSRLSSVKDCQ